MVTDSGPKLIEFNVRFGDPECQALMLRLRSDLLAALLAACDRELARFDLRWDPRPALVVVMAARGYPGSYQKGTEIRGLDRAAAIPGVQVFHAGTGRRPDGAVVATGGRVLGIAATGDSVRAARDSAYAAVDALDWPDGFCRRDIAHRAL
jgi:phosphoribosylamine--glycine ligase